MAGGILPAKRTTRKTHHPQFPKVCPQPPQRLPCRNSWPPSPFLCHSRNDAKREKVPSSRRREGPHCPMQRLMREAFLPACSWCIYPRSLVKAVTDWELLAVSEAVHWLCFVHHKGLELWRSIHVCCKLNTNTNSAHSPTVTHAELQVERLTW